MRPILFHFFLYKIYQHKDTPHLGASIKQVLSLYTICYPMVTSNGALASDNRLVLHFSNYLGNSM